LTGFARVEAEGDPEFSDVAQTQWASLNKQRWVMLAVIAVLFVLLNTAVIFLIYRGMTTDTDLIRMNAELAKNRLLTPGAFDALIAGTVAQTGAIAYTISRFLFPIG
jgi:hypothetical protein